MPRKVMKYDVCHTLYIYLLWQPTSEDIKSSLPLRVSIRVYKYDDKTPLETYSKNLATRRTDQTNKFALSLSIIRREKIFPLYFIDKALTNRPLSMAQVKTVTIDKTTSMLTVSHMTCQVTHIYEFQTVQFTFL